MHSAISAFKTDHIFHVQYSNYMYVHCSHPQHNLLSMHINMHSTPSTTHPTAFHSPPMLTTKHIASWQNGTRCRKLLWCHSHLVWLVFDGSIPACMHLFSFRKLFCDLSYNGARQGVLLVPTFKSSHIKSSHLYESRLLHNNHFVMVPITCTVWFYIKSGPSSPKERLQTTYAY